MPPDRLARVSFIGRLLFSELSSLEYTVVSGNSSRVQSTFAFFKHHRNHGSVPVHFKELITQQTSSHTVKTVTHIIPKHILN